jgi:hypothetical protein
VPSGEFTAGADVDDPRRGMRVDQLEQPFGCDRGIVCHGVTYSGYFVPSALMISWSSGKRPVACFEKITLPSTATSKTPRSPRVSSASIPTSLLIAAARLAAFGR